MAEYYKTESPIGCGIYDNCAAPDPTVGALKGIYEALGGDSDSFSGSETIETALTKIAEAADRFFVVHLDLSYDDGNTTFAGDKTFTEMYNAYNSGKLLILRFGDKSSQNKAQAMDCELVGNTGSGTIDFHCGLVIFRCSSSDGGTWSILD